MSAPPVSLREAQEAFRALEFKIRALPDEAAEPKRLDVGRAISLVLGVEKAIRGRRDDIRRHTPTFDLTHYDELGTSALAAWYLELNETDSTREVPALVEEAKNLRQLLVRLAELFVLTNDLDADQVAPLGKSQAHIEIAGELVQLASIFDQVWDEIDGRHPLERSTLDRAAELGTELAAAIGFERINTERSETTVMKHKAMTLLLEHYEEVRALIKYLDRDKDGAKLVPSIFKANMFGPRRSRDPRSPTGEPPTDPNPSPSGD